MKPWTRKIRLSDSTAHNHLKPVMVGKEQQCNSELFALPNPKSEEMKGNQNKPQQKHTMQKSHSNVQWLKSHTDLNAAKRCELKRTTPQTIPLTECWSWGSVGGHPPSLFEVCP